MIPCQYVLGMCEGQTTVIMEYMVTTSFVCCIFNTSRPKTTWNGGYFPYGILKSIISIENFYILTISLNFVPKGRIEKK